MARKRATSKAGRNKRIRCDSPKARTGRKLQADVTELEYDVIRSASAQAGESLSQYVRLTLLHRALKETIENARRDGLADAIKAQVTKHDVQRAEQIVASALVEAPSDARLQRLADQLTHLLSVDDG